MVIAAATVNLNAARGMSMNGIGPDFTRVDDTNLISLRLGLTCEQEAAHVD